MRNLGCPPSEIIQLEAPPNQAARVQFPGASLNLHLGAADGDRLPSASFALAVASLGAGSGHCTNPRPSRGP